MFFVPDIIEKKKRGLKLSKDEIQFIIDGYVGGSIPDYQISALLMAIYFKGMDEEETTDLTMAMAHSGEIVDLSSIDGIKVDKHSTGGIADTTTLVLLPLASSVGVKVAKMSGRGLGHTGGTVDKLESIPGFCCELDTKTFIDSVNTVGAAITGQSKNLVPADKILYALRDVTATVDSIPLIASSIMSKKIAGGADKIILDVKFGNGAFMKTFEDAQELGQLMVKIGELAGRETVAYITDMEQPLGLAIGNAIEVVEAIEVLKGKGHEDLLELCLEFASEMMLLAKIESDKIKAVQKLKDSIETGKALAKFKEIIGNQGGDSRVIQDYSLLPKAKYESEVAAAEDGYVKKIDAVRLGLTAMKLGAGRQKKDDIIDPAVGIWVYKKVGDKVKKGEVFAKILANDETKLSWAVDETRKAFEFTLDPIEKRKVIWAKITKDEVLKF
ncbi:pyrimidine-nucleoside phosphorylase [Tepidanaerobacter sp. EBM-38]|uniref:pyrimidine-nucleoside phosphorylase n=1 Tax=Tepidanaerobacter sp. EBM-38 TaxID=1918496 RepID=UPI000AFED625|nr:pyrimidine-nucleoside phosphorylase [Tepidanaerobacter sp. EBM-38]